MGWITLVLFCLFVVAAGAAAVGRYFAERRGEQALAAVIVSLGLVIVPIHALAWARLVSPLSVVAAVGVCSLGALAWPLSRSRRKSTFESWGAIVRFPWDALRVSWQERHVAGVGLLAFIGIALYTLRLAYLAPSTTWDGLWYHEAIVGFALQLGGVAEAVVESRHQYINGYPALAEYLQLFTVVAGRRDFIDVVPTVMGAVLLLASYVLLRRFSDRMHALGFALAIVFVPAVVLQFRSTLVDVTVVAFAAACMALLTRPVLRWVDVWITALAIGLLAGTKVSGAFLAALYGVLLAVRVLAIGLRERRIPGSVAQLAAAVTLVVAIGAPRYVQNFVVHDNPIWPLDFRHAGLKFKGKKNAAPRDKPPSEVIAGLLSPPAAGGDSADSRGNGYGNALPYTVLPLAALATLLLAWRLLRALLRKDAIEPQEAALLALTIASGIGLWFVPAVWWARLHLHAVVVAIALNAWLLHGPRAGRLADALIGALLLSELVTLSWSTSAWGVTREQASELSNLPASERRLRDLGQSIRFPEPLARALEAEVGPGELVVYDGPYLFLANLWNSRYSNRVQYVDCPKEGYANALDNAGAKWVVASRDECKKQLDDAGTNWERVGQVDRGTLAYRRRPAPPGAPPQPALAPDAPRPAVPPLAAKPDCRTVPPPVAYVAPRVSDADAQAAMKVRKLKGEHARLLNGPIVGAVSDRSATIWIKADRPTAWQLEFAPVDHPQQTHRIEGAILTPVNDFTGVIALTDLRPRTRYIARVALRESETEAWSPTPPDTEANFLTMPAPGSHGHLRIAVGADITHTLDQPIFAQILQAAPDAVFFIGDQMYSDALEPNFTSYANKYTQAWKIFQLRDLMQQVPTFMIWDDHEIVDDYYAGKSERYAPARLAYELYVQQHNPPPLRNDKLYFTVQLGDVGVFALDTRSERSDPRTPESPTKSMLGAEQKADLLHWLACNKSTIKVIITTVVMSDHINSRDSWNAFPTEREEIFGFIERERIDDVVILSGDQHWSAVFVHDRPHLRIYEFLPTPLSKERASAPTYPANDILARDDDNFVFGVVDFDTSKAPATVAFTLCAGGKPCRPGAEPAPKTGLNVRGADENVPFTLKFSTADFGVR